MAGTVAAVAERGLAAAVGEEETWRVEYDFPGGVRAPLEKGETIGTATLYIEGTPAAQTPLLAGEDWKSATSQVPSGGCLRAGYCCCNLKFARRFHLWPKGFAPVNFRAQGLHFNRFNLFKTIHRQPSNVGMLFFRRGKERTNCPNKERFGEL